MPGTGNNENTNTTNSESSFAKGIRQFYDKEELFLNLVVKAQAAAGLYRASLNDAEEKMFESILKGNFERIFPGKSLPPCFELADVTEISEQQILKIPDSVKALFSTCKFLKHPLPDSIKIQPEDIGSGLLDVQCRTMIRELCSYYSKYKDKFFNGNFKTVGVIVYFAASVFTTLSKANPADIQTRDEIEKYIDFFRVISIKVEPSLHESEFTNPVRELKAIITTLERIFKKVREDASRLSLKERLFLLRDQLNNIVDHAFEMTCFVGDSNFYDRKMVFYKPLLDYVSSGTLDKNTFNESVLTKTNLDRFICFYAHTLADIRKGNEADPITFDAIRTKVKQLHETGSGFYSKLAKNKEFMDPFCEMLVSVLVTALLAKHADMAGTVAAKIGELNFFATDTPEFRALIGQIEHFVGKFKSSQTSVRNLRIDRRLEIKKDNTAISLKLKHSEDGPWVDTFQKTCDDFDPFVDFNVYYKNIKVIVSEINLLHDEYLQNFDKILRDVSVLHFKFVKGVNKIARHFQGAAVRDRFADLPDYMSYRRSVPTQNSNTDSLVLSETWSPHLFDWFSGAVNYSESGKANQWFDFSQPAYIKTACSVDYIENQSLFQIELNLEFFANRYFNQEPFKEDEYYLCKPYQDFLSMGISTPRNLSNSDLTWATDNDNNDDLKILPFNRLARDENGTSSVGMTISMVKCRYDSTVTRYPYSTANPHESMFAYKYMKWSYFYAPVDAAKGKISVNLNTVNRVRSANGKIEFSVDLEQHLVAMAITNSSSNNSMTTNTAKFSYNFTYDIKDKKLTLATNKTHRTAKAFNYNVFKNIKTSENFSSSDYSISEKNNRPPDYVDPDEELPVPESSSSHGVTPVPSSPLVLTPDPSSPLVITPDPSSPLVLPPGAAITNDQKQSGAPSNTGVFSLVYKANKTGHGPIIDKDDQAIEVDPPKKSSKVSRFISFIACH